MSSKLELYKAIAERERASRKEAERLLDEKSLELYEKTKNLETSRDELGSMASLLSHIMSSAPDCIFTCSSDFKIQGVNRTTEQRFDSPAANLVGMSIEEIFPGITDAISGLSDGSFEVEGLSAHPNKSDAFPVEIRGRSGKIYDNVKFILFAHDITEKERIAADAERMQQHVNETRRLESIGTLSAGLAHEINTPIQFIGDNLGFLMEALFKIKGSYQQYDHLRQVAIEDGQYPVQVKAISEYNSKVKLDTLISDIEECVVESVGGIQQVRDIVLLIKEFSHPGTVDKAPVNINKLVLDVLRICRSRSTGITKIETDLDEKILEVLCLRGQIQQVIMNLIINGIDAIDESGIPNGTLKVQTLIGENAAYIDISDSGCGIPDAIRSKIFDPFFTTKAIGKGTGQGLAFAMNTIVNLHQGKLSIIDKEGFATTFRIELPYQHKENSKLEDQSREYAA